MQSPAETTGSRHFIISVSRAKDSFSLIINMGRSPCCSKVGLNRGAWTAEEDEILCKYIRSHGEGNWRTLPMYAGLKRCGKSCRLRWVNYLRPDIKRGRFSEEEEDLIIRLHNLLGNRWSLIAGRIPGRTDNEIKNYWNTYLSKQLGLKKHSTKAKRICRVERPKPSNQETQKTPTVSPSPQKPMPIKCAPETKPSTTAETEKAVSVMSWQELLLSSGFTCNDSDSTAMDVRNVWEVSTSFTAPDAFNNEWMADFEENEWQSLRSFILSESDCARENRPISPIIQE